MSDDGLWAMADVGLGQLQRLLSARLPHVEPSLTLPVPCGRLGCAGLVPWAGESIETQSGALPFGCATPRWRPSHQRPPRLQPPPPSTPPLCHAHRDRCRFTPRQGVALLELQQQLPDADSVHTAQQPSVDASRRTE